MGTEQRGKLCSLRQAQSNILCSVYTKGKTRGAVNTLIKPEGTILQFSLDALIEARGNINHEEGQSLQRVWGSPISLISLE